MTLEVVDTLRDLVRIPSVNPMGRDVSGPQYYEYAVTDHIEKLFDQLGLPWIRQEVAPKRSNILARLDGHTPPEEGGPLIMFEAHQDTVPVEGMTIEPWTADLQNDRVFGRGSCDIKGGMASMLTAISRLAQQKPKGMPTIIMACTVNEEHGYSGATELARSWNEDPSKILPRAPDAVVVAEPTLLDVVVAHKGVVRWRCQTHGKAVHSSKPEQGVNALYKMARVLSAIETYARDEVPQLGEHPRVGKPTMSVGTITGGISVNTVPDCCTIEIDRRLLPGEDPQSAYQHAVDAINRLSQLSPPPEHQPPNISARGLSDQDNGPLGQRLCSAAGACGTSNQLIGVPFGTDAAVFSAAGVPTVVFGPGSIDQAHTCDEWIAVEQLNRATDILVQFCQDWSS